MSNFFKKAAIFTDIHFGKKNNDRQYNLDCEKFIDWFLEQAKSNGCDKILFLGDFFDNRHSIHISTLNYALSALEKLNNSGIPVFMIPGNHDEFYKDKREISSIAVGRNLKNITIYNDIIQIENVTFCPWLVGSEWQRMPEISKTSSYVFGHFELPHFMMNAMVEMPDHDGLNASHFDDVEFMVFSGHFHKRQVKGKVCYVGSPFCQTFADAWDDERGMVVLEWGKIPQFLNWADGPKYKTLTLADVLNSPTKYLNDKSFIKVTPDIELTYDELQFIKEVLTAHFNPRKMDFLNGVKRTEEHEFADENVKFQSVEQIVIEGLSNIDSLTLDKNLLIELYRGLN